MKTLALCWVLYINYCYDECQYADCRFAECFYVECHGALHSA